ncbi:MAG: hypothetical protein I3273_01950 [Candidatus Moeniiplasma glomeromycotorum]|nr:hypothetical protein [Candidatus Moeniiplasma glomeromycotorum]MCE8167117.1 hypothetical protein [Candidatus Moeniiplasma glomeromycotorum]MCE8168871.1 hypothetical protein [Candidatus Moeniiplasma glomeromycotorum]
MKSKVIFLNSSSTVGKTSTSKVVQHLSEEFWLILEMDNFLGAMPKKSIVFSDRTKLGFRFVAEPKTNKLVKVGAGSYTN